jgi:hypothetical protein
LSSEGKKQMMVVSKPRLEKRMTSPSDDISAVAMPTCSSVQPRPDHPEEEATSLVENAGGDLEESGSVQRIANK